MNDLYDVLEECLKALERGAEVESVLAHHPDHANELRPLLDAAIQARRLVVPEPSAESFRRGRAALLQRAAQMRESKVPARGRVIPLFQRLAITFAVLALFLVSGTGLVRASSGALPGEKLYPVKRTWEGLRLLFIFDHERREALKSEFENERLHEVNELLAEGRHETIQFAGVWMEANGNFYVSGIPVILTEATRMPAEALTDGAPVVVRGRTNADGFVELESIELLPLGTVVPVGNPVEVESEEGHEAENGKNQPVEPTPSGGAAPASGNEAGGLGNDAGPEKKLFEIEGTIRNLSGNVLVINGQTIHLDNTEIKGTLAVGAFVKVEGYFAEDGRFVATRIEVKKSSSNANDSGGDSNSNVNGGGGGAKDGGGNTNDGGNDNEDDHGDDGDENDND